MDHTPPQPDRRDRWDLASPWMCVAVAIALTLAVWASWGLIRDRGLFGDGNGLSTASAASMRRADAIRPALEAFHAANGRYPESLAELTPRYAAAIEEPAAGEWRYQTLSNSAAYELGFTTGPSGRVDYWWSSTVGRWVGTEAD